MIVRTLATNTQKYGAKINANESVKVSKRVSTTLVFLFTHSGASYAPLASNLLRINSVWSPFHIIINIAINLDRNYPPIIRQMSNSILLDLELHHFHSTHVNLFPLRLPVWSDSIFTLNYIVPGRIACHMQVHSIQSST